MSVAQALRVSLVLAALAATSGCLIDTTPNYSPGSASVESTINGSIDPNYCTLSSAATLRVTFYDSRGGSAGSYDSPCTNFGMVVDLDPGTYTADALFVDSSGQARTTTAKLAPFSIYRGSVTTVPVDFPNSSFF